MNEDEERYVVTPKGLLHYALMKAEIECSDQQFEHAWLQFVTDMKELDYIKEEE